MSESMVERVARAICEAAGDGWREGTYQLNTGPNFELEDHDADPLNNVWRFIARAAIEAMREPTEAQLDVVTPDVSKDIADYERYAAGETYRAMIDAALKP